MNTNTWQKLWDAVNGSKTYILAAAGILVGLIGHFWGPVTLPGGASIPAQTWNQVWTTIYGSSIVAAIRHGISKAPVPVLPPKP